MDQNTVIFDNVSLSVLAKDIYTNRSERNAQLQNLITLSMIHIKDPSTIALIMPYVRDLMDTSVRNDEMLVKLANIIQKCIAASTTQGSIDDFYPQEEIKMLLQDMKNTTIPEAPNHLPIQLNG